MDSDKIKQTVDESFDSIFATWSKQIETELYPGAFADSYSWLRVKNSLAKNNRFLKEALKEVLVKLLSDE